MEKNKNRSQSISPRPRANSGGSSRKSAGADMEAVSPQAAGQARAHSVQRPSVWAALQCREIGAGHRGVPSPSQFSRCMRSSEALVSRLRLEHTHAWHDGCVNTISFAQSGRLLISGSDDRHIVMGDWQTGAMLHRWHSGHRNNVFQAKTMPFSNERTLVSCAADGQVRVSEVKDDGEVETRGLVQHRGRAHKLAIDHTSPHLVLSTGEDGYVHQIDTRMGQGATELVRVQGPRKVDAPDGGSVRWNRVVGQNSIALHPANPNYFCTGGDDPICRIWDRRRLPCASHDADNFGYAVGNLAPTHLRRGATSGVSITCAVYSHDGREILASYNDELIYLLDVSSAGAAVPFPYPTSETAGEEERGGGRFINDGDSAARGYLSRYQGHRNRRTVKGVNFMGARSEFVVSGSDCGNVFVWGKESEQVICMHKGDDDVVNCLEPHPHLAILATSGIADDIKVWAPTGEPFADFEAAERQALRNARGRARLPALFSAFGWDGFLGARSSDSASDDSSEEEVRPEDEVDEVYSEDEGREYYDDDDDEDLGIVFGGGVEGMDSSDVDEESEEADDEDDDEEQEEEACARGGVNPPTTKAAEHEAGKNARRQPAAGSDVAKGGLGSTKRKRIDGIGAASGAVCGPREATLTGTEQLLQDVESLGQDSDSSCSVGSSRKDALDSSEAEAGEANEGAGVGATRSARIRRCEKRATEQQRDHRSSKPKKKK